MSRLTTYALLEALKTEITTRFSVTPSVRLWRPETEDVERSLTPAYFLEPGTTTFERINSDSPRVQLTVRFLSEYTTSYDGIGTALKNEMEFFERVARDLMKTPRLTSGAFVLRTSTFSDAPSGFSVSAIEDGYSTIYGGIEISVVIE